MVDSNNNRIQVYTPEGKFLRQWGGEGVEDGKFREPSGIAIIPTPKGEEIVVAERWSVRTQVFTPQGEFLRERKWKQSNRFEAPRGITTMVPSPGREAEVIVIDHYGKQIRMFTPRGEFLRGWKCCCSEDDCVGMRPDGVAPLPGGGIAVTDPRNGCIRIFGLTLV